MSEKPLQESPKSTEPSERRRSQAERYRLDPDQSEVLKKYPPKFLAKGGEHFVYEIGSEETGDLRDLVVKADFQRARRIQSFLEKHHVASFDELPEEIKQLALKDLHEQNRKYQVMREAFGSAHAAPQKMSFAEVPINKAIAEEVFGPGSEKTSAWTVVTLQKRAKELRDPDARILDFGSEYLEAKSMSTAQYERLAEANADKRLSALLRAAESDPELRRQMAEFIDKAVGYTEQEGEILDFIGSRNVYFYNTEKPDGGRAWSYRILDGFHAKPGRREMEVARAALAKFDEQGVISDRDYGSLLNALAYTRSVNAAAEKLDLPQRIKLLDDFPKTKLPMLMRALREAGGFVDPRATRPA